MSIVSAHFRVLTFARAAAAIQDLGFEFIEADLNLNSLIADNSLWPIPQDNGYVGMMGA